MITVGPHLSLSIEGRLFLKISFKFIHFEKKTTKPIKLPLIQLMIAVLDTFQVGWFLLASCTCSPGLCCLLCGYQLLPIMSIPGSRGKGCFNIPMMSYSTINNCSEQPPKQYFKFFKLEKQVVQKRRYKEVVRAVRTELQSPEKDCLWHVLQCWLPYSVCTSQVKCMCTQFKAGFLLTAGMKLRLTNQSPVYFYDCHCQMMNGMAKMFSQS